MQRPNKPQRGMPPQAAAPAPASVSGVGKNDYGVQTEHKRTIDGAAYTTTLYGAEEGFAHIPWMIRLASGPAGLALETLGGVAAAGGDLTRAKVSGTEVTAALDALAYTIVEAGGADKVREMMTHTLVRKPNGTTAKVEDEFGVLFQGRYAHMMKVLAFVLEVNYAPFLRASELGIWSRLTQMMSLFAGESSEQPPA